jgi:hypothetical protein
MMKTRMLSLVVALLAAQVFAADQPQAPANPGFEKLKSLVGEWKGKMKEGEEVKTTYRLVGADSAIEEYLSHGNMVTIYHPDGSRLMLTHYCAAQNQPRMRAAAFKSGDDTLKFSFVDATNMSGPNAQHMHNLAFTFRDADHFTQEWTLYDGGKEAQKVVINFERVK